MPIRKVVLNSELDDDLLRSISKKEKPVVLQASSDLNQLEIGNIARSYLGYEPINKVLYKLHSDVSKATYTNGFMEYTYNWLSMWNSLSYTSIKGEDEWNKIEDALMAALKNDWKVIQVNGDVFKNILSFLEE